MASLGGMFNKTSSSASYANTSHQAAQQSEVSGTALSLLGSDHNTVNMLDGGAVAGAFDFGKFTVRDSLDFAGRTSRDSLDFASQSARASLDFGRDALDLSGATYRDSLDFARAASRESFGIASDVAARSVGIASEVAAKSVADAGDVIADLSKWLIGGIAVVGVAYMFKARRA